MDAKEAERLMGFAPGELEETARAYETDCWPAGRTVRLGRPPISKEPTAVISGRVEVSVLEAFDEKARKCGQTRAERLRALLAADVGVA